MTKNDVTKTGVKKKQRKKEQTEYFFDYSLLFIVLFLMGFGLVMIYSVSSYIAMQDYGDAAYFFKKQVSSSLVGLVAMIIVANIPYVFWEKVSVLAYFVGLLLLLLIIPFGVERYGAKRWIYLGPISFQPAEAVKVSIILFIAILICKMGVKTIKTWKGFLFIIGVALPPVLMIWKITSNMSSAIIVMGIAIFMLFVASPDYKKFIICAGAVLAIAAIVVFSIVTAYEQALMEEGTLREEDVVDSLDIDYRGERVLAWLDPEAFSDGKGFQTLQALYAIGSGGIWGKGLGQSMQKLGFIPEAQNDMILSIICEELGLFGAASIIFMFIMLLWRLMIIANNAPDLYGALLVVGVMGHIAIQVILNVAVVTNSIPNTGISLPFISYGGSSALFLFIEIGIVLNVAKRIQLKEL